jgi:hypothetical protein
MNSKLKLRDSTKSIFETEWSFEIAILPKPLTFPLLLSKKCDAIIAWAIFLTPLGEHSHIPGHVLSTPCSSPTKENTSCFGNQTCLDPWMLVTKVFGTKMAFFFLLTIGVPTKFAWTPLALWVRT